MQHNCPVSFDLFSEPCFSELVLCYISKEASLFFSALPCSHLSLAEPGTSTSIYSEKFIVDCAGHVVSSCQTSKSDALCLSALRHRWLLLFLAKFSPMTLSFTGIPDDSNFRPLCWRVSNAIVIIVTHARRSSRMSSPCLFLNLYASVDSKWLPTLPQFRICAHTKFLVMHGALEWPFRCGYCVYSI